MAYITKRGNSYSVRYTYEDEHGKSCDKWESFPTKEEATNRKKQIEHELAAGTFLIPSSVTVAEFLMDWLPKQCSKHKWAPKTYESNLSTIQNLIIPYIGSMEMQKLKPYHMENLYTTLSKTPCGSYIEGKKQELTEKQKQRFLSGTTIHEVHRLLGTAFQYAVEWGILVKSPVPVDSPKKSTQERTIWTVEEMRAALDSMEDPILHLAVHLTLVGALREGEIVGLTPEDLDFDAADGIGTFRINKSMQRVRKEAQIKDAAAAHAKLKPIHDIFIKKNFKLTKDAYAAQHKEELDTFNKAVRTLMKLNGSTAVDFSALDAEFSALQSSSAELRTQLETLQPDISALKNIRKYIDMVLNKQQLSAPNGKTSEKESVLKKLHEAKATAAPKKPEQQKNTPEL